MVVMVVVVMVLVVVLVVVLVFVVMVVVLVVVVVVMIVGVVVWGRYNRKAQPEGPTSGHTYKMKSSWLERIWPRAGKEGRPVLKIPLQWNKYCISLHQG